MPIPADARKSMGHHSSRLPAASALQMPKVITDIKQFLDLRKQAKSVRIYRGEKSTKFKLRCPKYLYTIIMPDAERAKKLEASLPPSECRAGLPADSRGSARCAGRAARDGHPIAFLPCSGSCFCSPAQGRVPQEGINSFLAA